MLRLADWAQGIVLLHPNAALVVGRRLAVFQVHMVLGMTIFLLFPFSRLVHVWSGRSGPWPTCSARRRSLRAGAGNDLGTTGGLPAVASV